MPGLIPAPYYSETLLPVPPRKTDCVGETCPVVEYNGSCFLSNHHLFFQHEVFMSLEYPFNELVNDENAQKKLAHCRHNSTHPNSWHNLYDFTVLPEAEVAARYLEESQLLSGLAVLVKDMSADINSIFSDSPKARYRVFAEGTYRQKLERFETRQMEYGNRIAQVGSIEVMPAVIVGSLVSKLGEARNHLEQQAKLVPELAHSELARMAI
jgi:hypothetical protein